MEVNKFRVFLGTGILASALCIGVLTAPPDPNREATVLDTSKIAPIIWRHWSCVNRTNPEEVIADFAQAKVENIERKNNRVYWRIYTPERPSQSVALVVSIDPDRAVCGYSR